MLLSGANLIITTNNASTNVEVRTSGTNIVVAEIGTSHTWSYAASSVMQVEFHGGDGDDRFTDNVDKLKAIAYGGAGNDWLIGSTGNDQLFGEVGDDVLLGFPGDDSLGGGDGVDRLKGGYGNDTMNGGPGNDNLVAVDGGTRDTIQGAPGWTLSGSTRAADRATASSMPRRGTRCKPCAVSPMAPTKHLTAIASLTRRSPAVCTTSAFDNYLFWGRPRAEPG